jgi:hypothetical protein
MLREGILLDKNKIKNMIQYITKKKYKKMLKRCFNSGVDTKVWLLGTRTKGVKLIYPVFKIIDKK